jgi:hypothetical protein
MERSERVVVRSSRLLRFWLKVSNTTRYAPASKISMAYVPSLKVLRNTSAICRLSWHQRLIAPCSSRPR